MTLGGEPRGLELYTAIEARLAALGEQVKSSNQKLDSIHLSLEKDISEVKGTLDGQGQRIAQNELRLARLQGAGAALALGLPFVAVALDHLLH